MNHYAMIIEWSVEDQTYIVSFPEWEAAGSLAHTHGDTYIDAVKAGAEMLNFMIDARLAHGESLPAPRVYAPANA